MLRVTEGRFGNLPKGLAEIESRRTPARAKLPEMHEFAVIASLAKSLPTPVCTRQSRGNSRAEPNDETLEQDCFRRLKDDRRQ